MTAVREPTNLDAVALLEIASIARGFVVLDDIVKAARVTILHGRPVSPGKFIAVFGGAVADVEEALEAGRARAGSEIIDELWLPYAHRALIPAMSGQLELTSGESIGIVETGTVASALVAADAALKTSDVAVVRLHLAIGIGGKAYFLIAGDLADVQAAVEGASAVVDDKHIVAVELIAQPQPEILGFLHGRAPPL